MLVVGLIRQGRGDLPNVDLGQDKHLLRLEPSRGASKDHEGCVLTLSQIAKGRMARPVHDQRQIRMFGLPSCSVPVGDDDQGPDETHKGTR